MQAEASRARTLLPLRVFYFASFTALGAFAPFFPRWLVARGVDGVAMGAVLATLPAMGLIGPPLVGILADSLGLHGRLLRFASLGATVSLIVLAIVLGVWGNVPFIVLFLLVLAHAAFRSPMVVMADVLAIEAAPRAGIPYARLRNWGSVGSLVGAIGVGRIIDPEGRIAFPAAVAIPLFVAVVATFTIPEREGAPAISLGDEARTLLASPDVPIFMATAFCAEIALSSYDVGFALRLGELNASSAFIGLAWAVGIISEIAVMAAVNRLMQKVIASRLVVFALGVAAVRCALLASLRSLPLLALIQPLHGLSVALFWISCVSYIKARVAPHALASAQGLFAGVMAAGSVTGMLIWGAVYRVGGGSMVFGAASLVALGAAVVALVWTTRAHEVRQAV